MTRFSVGDTWPPSVPFVIEHDVPFPGPPQWICVAAGSPGTWVPVGTDELYEWHHRGCESLPDGDSPTFPCECDYAHLLTLFSSGALLYEIERRQHGAG